MAPLAPLATPMTARGDKLSLSAPQRVRGSIK